MQNAHLYFKFHVSSFSEMKFYFTFHVLAFKFQVLLCMKSMGTIETGTMHTANPGRIASLVYPEHSLIVTGIIRTFFIFIACESGELTAALNFVTGVPESDAESKYESKLTTESGSVAKHDSGSR